MDYTEGATATDIENALSSSRPIGPPRRRDSSLGTSYVGDDDTAIFGGPSHTAMPSSVTAMVHERPLARRFSRSSARDRRKSGVSDTSERDRLRGSRRTSSDSQVVADEYASDPETPAIDDDARSAATRSRRSGRSPDSPEVEPRSLFDNLANLFSSRAAQPNDATSRRGSVSRRSTGGFSRRRRSGDSDDDSGDERWGYSSAEEDTSDDEDLVMDEHRPNIEDIDNEYAASEGGYMSEDNGSSGGNLPMMSGDPLFGDTRIDMDDETAAFLAEDSADRLAGPPSRQTIYLADEDTNMRFVGYYAVPFRKFLWRLGCVCTLGILALLGHWIPTLWLRFVAKEKAFKELGDGFIVVEVCPLITLGSLV